MNNLQTNQYTLVGIIYLIFLSLVVTCCLSVDNWQLRENLKWISPLTLEFNFLLILIGIVINLELLKKYINNITKSTWYCLSIIAISGLLLTMFVAPQTHKIYFDEDIYLNIGQNIACLKKAGMCNDGRVLYDEYTCNRLEYNKEPNAWPYLLSIMFKIFGTNHVVGYLLNNFFWFLSILTVFFICYTLFKDEKAALFAALIISLIPEGIIWSNTTAVETSSALFAGIAFLSVVIFVRYPKKEFLFLTSFLISFSFQFRPESILILLPIFLCVLFIVPKELIKTRTYYFFLLIMILATPHLIHLYAVKGESWGASGAKFSFSYFYENFIVNFFFYFKNIRFPAIFSYFCCIGLIVPQIQIEQQKNTYLFYNKEKLAIFVWLLAFWGIFVFFYAGSYNYGADVRFSLLSYMPISILAGFGISNIQRWFQEKWNIKWINHSIIIIILINFISFIPYIRSVRQEAWGARFDHNYSEIMANKIPAHSIILTHNPTIFLLFGQNATQASIALYEEDYIKQLFEQYTGGVYFHYNYWCNVDDLQQKAFCQNILNKYYHSQIMSFSEQKYKYKLFKLSMKHSN